MKSDIVKSDQERKIGKLMELLCILEWTAGLVSVDILRWRHALA